MIAVRRLSHSRFENAPMTLVDSRAVMSVEIGHVLHEGELRSPADHPFGKMSIRVEPISVGIARVEQRRVNSVQRQQRRLQVHVMKTV